jgi:hypothetical protein
MIDHVASASLHRKLAGAGGDRLIFEGTITEMLLIYAGIQPSKRPNYMMMQGEVTYKHPEIDRMAREAGLLDD